VPRQSGGRGLLSVEDTVFHEQLSLRKYLISSEEPLLQQAFECSQWSFPPESPSKFKAKRKQDHYDAWKLKPLHGQFVREVDGSIDVSQQWKWLNISNLMKETEGLIMAAQNQAITTNCIKVNIFHQPGSALCHLCGCHVESVDHILSSCSTIAQTQYKTRYDNFARLIHYELSEFSVTVLHKPPPVLDNSSMKILLFRLTDIYHMTGQTLCVSVTTVKPLMQLI